MSSLLRVRFRVSSRKFYDIVNEKQERLIPTIPEEYILSKYLKEGQPVKKSDTYDRNIAKSKPTQINYQQIAQKYPYGSILEQNYKNISLNLVSLNFQNIKLRDVFSLCDKFQPDLILVQGSPEQYLPKFNLLPQKKDVFSDKLYLQQLILSHKEAEEHIISEDVAQYFHSLVEEKERIRKDKIFIKDTRSSVDDEVTLMAAHYVSQKRISLMFGDMPLQPWKEWICNSHTLMELQQLFKHVCKNYPFYDALSMPLDKIAALIKPQTFLNLKDRYLATLVEMLVAQNRHKKVLILAGTMQNQAVWQIIADEMLLHQNEKTGRQEFTPLVQYLVGPPVKSSILRNIQGWQIIEKHIILDVLRYGTKIVDIPFEQFTVTNKIIDHYGIILNSYHKQNILKFRFDKTLEYLALMQSQIEQGKQLKKKFMMREAIRSQEESDD